MNTDGSWAHRPGDILNNTWEILAPIGLGGPSEVYRAVNQANGHEVAIKVLKAEFASNAAFQDLMRRESLLTIHHDAIVRYWGMQRREDGGLFLVMDFIDGPSLEKVMERGPVPEDVLVRIARRLLGGLEAAHAKGVFHRDISPDNVILRDDDPDKATLIDFGIAKELGGDKRTVIGQGFAGKYEYAAPEQFDGKVDARSDLYSLGITLLAARAGQAPSLGSSHLEILKAKSQKPDLSGIGEPLRSLLAQVLEPQPEHRLPSAAAALSLIGSGQASPGVELDRDRDARRDIAEFGSDAPPPSPPQTPRAVPPARRSVLPMVLTLVVALALAGGGAFFFLGPGGEWWAQRSWDAPEPYAASAAQRGAVVVLSGHAPGEAARASLEDDLADFATIEGGLALGRGVPDEGWFDAFRALVAAALDLDNWSVAMSGREGRIEGTAPDPETLARVRAAAEEIAARGSYEIEMSLALAVQPLARTTVDRVLEEYRNCGPLVVAGQGDLPPGAPIEVRGRLATEGDASELSAALERVAEGRDVRVAVDTVNPPICMAETLLPPTIGDSGVEIRLGYGTRPGTAPDGLYREGENPVIDLVVPEAMTGGYVYAFVVDLEGVVFHLLPHVNRTENRLSEIGTVENGRRTIRLSYPLAEAANDRLAFSVGPPFGNSLLVVVISERELFPQLRVGSETVEALTEDLGRALKRTEGAAFVIERAMMDLRPR